MFEALKIAAIFNASVLAWIIVIESFCTVRDWRRTARYCRRQELADLTREINRHDIDVYLETFVWEDFNGG